MEDDRGNTCRRKSGEERVADMALIGASIFFAGSNDDNQFIELSVDNIQTARVFYGEKLGLSVSEADGVLTLQVGGGRRVLMFLKQGHSPSRHAVLYFVVDNIADTVAQLILRGVRLQSHDYEIEDGQGIQHSPLIAWFTDPAGNLLCVMQRY